MRIASDLITPDYIRRRGALGQLERGRAQTLEERDELRSFRGGERRKEKPGVLLKLRTQGGR